MPEGRGRTADDEDLKVTRANRYTMQRRGSSFPLYKYVYRLITVNMTGYVEKIETLPLKTGAKNCLTKGDMYLILRKMHTLSRENSCT